MNQKYERFLSLDVFRGMTVCFMIIVNTPGSGAKAFAPLLHAEWHGFTVTDLVFPSFLFAVGTAMSFGASRFMTLNAPFWKLVIKRTLLIFLIGLVINWFPFFDYSDSGIHWRSFAGVRILGVLQRIALCYFLAMLVVRFVKSQRGIIYVSLLFLFLYWLALYVWGDASDPLSITGNAGLFIDKALLGEAHMYHGEGLAFDPEGFLSTIPATVNVLIGYLTGTYIIRAGKGGQTIGELALAGCGLLFVAWCWSHWLPFNKKLWTSSFVMLTVALDMIAVAGLVYVIELRKVNARSLTVFFDVFGKNPLFIYVLADVLVILLYSFTLTPGVSPYTWISLNIFQAIAPGPWGSLLFAMSFMLFCWLIGYVLYRRRIFIKV